MNRTPIRCARFLVAVIVAGNIFVSDASSGETTSKDDSPVDVRKSIIELPVERLIESGRPPEPLPVADVGKRFIERPAERLIESAHAPESERVADPGKKVIELPVKKLLDSRKPRREDPANVVATEAAEEADPDDNPRVRPGLVRWHANFDAACAASAESGKPVLLFQLLGRLDQRFT
jgi:hypothetical protein